jgi:excinuclease UvrABC nuclease subunit
MKNNTKIIPVVTYSNAYIDKSNILKKNRGKSCIYRWVNKLNNDSYVGSSIDLTNRLRLYYNIKHLTYKSGNSRINKALLKYGYENFKLEILEYCNKESVIIREQYYLDLLSPKYNILKIAGSSLGFKHSPETLKKFKDRKISTGHITTVVNKKTNSVKLYDSIRAAARDLHTSHQLLLNYINTEKLYKGTYIITRKITN